MFTLTKASSPGWDKLFNSVEEARAELLTHICKACLLGGEWDDVDENGVTTGIKITDKLPNQTDIRALLGTACGSEYWFEEDDTR